MRLLLDTCVLYWLIDDQSKLSAGALAAIRTHKDQLFVSAVSAFEVGMNHHRGRVPLPRPPEEWFARTLALYAARTRVVTSAIAFRAAGLPQHHKDPFDRLIIATAAEYGMAIVSSDRQFAAYTEVTTVW